jgi:hypothetical protein
LKRGEKLDLDRIEGSIEKGSLKAGGILMKEMEKRLRERKKGRKEERKKGKRKKEKGKRKKEKGKRKKETKRRITLCRFQFSATNNSWR